MEQINKATEKKQFTTALFNSLTDVKKELSFLEKEIRSANTPKRAFLALKNLGKYLEKMKQNERLQAYMDLEKSLHSVRMYDKTRAELLEDLRKVIDSIEKVIVEEKVKIEKIETFLQVIQSLVDKPEEVAKVSLYGFKGIIDNPNLIDWDKITIN